VPPYFGRRLVPISTLLVASFLTCLVFGIALFAFAAFVDHVRQGAKSLVGEAQSTVEALPGRVDALTAAKSAAPRLIDPALLLVIIGNQRRVTLLRRADARGSSSIAVVVRARADRSAEPEARGAFARLALGLATAVGLPIARARVKDLDIYATENQSVFVADARGFVPALSAAAALALILSAIFARVLSREAFRPLVEVTRALERFSAGDFTPELIDASRHGELGALARAYNGAVAQVERSFEERARATASIRQFIADASHQLRTPLTVIRGFVTILRQNWEANEEVAHILGSMAQQTALMSALIEKLILLERWEYESADARAQRCDLGRLISEAVSPLALSNDSRTVDLELQSGAMVFADPDDITYAITNTVENALKYTTGRVAVTLREVDAGFCVSVADEGPGMPADQAERAFERFYRGWRRDVEGSGLGLAIAKRAIERAHGTTYLQSDPERGTVIRFYLPRDQAQP